MNSYEVLVQKNNNEPELIQMLADDEEEAQALATALMTDKDDVDVDMKVLSVKRV